MSQEDKRTPRERLWWKLIGTVDAPDSTDGLLDAHRDQVRDQYMEAVAVLHPMDDNGFCETCRVPGIPDEPEWWPCPTMRVFGAVKP